MGLQSTDSMTVPTYFIYRDVQLGKPYDPAVSPVFYPPKGSDELFDALRLKYPHVSTHSERMRDAVIEFLLEERETEAAAANAAFFMPAVSMTPSTEDTTSPWTHQSWPSMSSTTLSSPDMSSLETPAHMASPDLSLVATKDYTSPCLERMTGVFSLSTSSLPKQRVRRRMTEAERAEYRQRRVMKACDKCAKRKRKECTHNQVTTELSSSKSANAAKAPASAHQGTVIDETENGINRPQVQDVAIQSCTKVGPVDNEVGMKDLTLLLNGITPDLDCGDMIYNFADLDDPTLFSGDALSPAWSFEDGADQAVTDTHSLFPFDDSGIPTHISPALLDTATYNTGEVRLQTLQEQVRQQSLDFERLQNADQTWIKLQHDDVQPEMSPSSPETATNTSLSSQATTSMPPTKCSNHPIFDKSFEHLSVSPTEFFMLRRRSSLTHDSRACFSTYAAHSDGQVAARAQLARHTNISALLATVTDSDDSTAVSSKPEHLIQTSHVQHVGRLSCHNRYRDHHGRQALQTILQVCCGLLVLAWAPSILAVSALLVGPAAAVCLAVSSRVASARTPASCLLRSTRDLTGTWKKALAFAM